MLVPEHIRVDNMNIIQLHLKGHYNLPLLTGVFHCEEAPTAILCDSLYSYDGFESFIHLFRLLCRVVKRRTLMHKQDRPSLSNDPVYPDMFLLVKEVLNMF